MHRAGWKSRAIVLGWFGLAAVVFVFISRPKRGAPARPGWTYWRQAGPTRAIAFSSEGVLAGGLHGLFRLNPDGTAAAIGLPGVSGPTFVNAIAITKRGDWWVGHNHGLSLRTGGAWRAIGEADGLPDARVAAVTIARDESVWVGTAKGAVHVRSPEGWNRDSVETLARRDGLLHDSVSAILEDRDGGLWFGNYAAPEGGLSRLKDGQWTHWTCKEGLPHPNVTSLLLARDNHLWVGCGFFSEGGAAVFGNISGNWKLEYTIPVKELAGPKVRSLFEDRKGYIWLGSEYNGLTIRLGDKTVRVLKPEDGLPAWEVMTILQAEDGAMWLGTLAGVVRIEKEAVERLLEKL